MRDRIDPTSPIPLYVQVAEAIRYRVATGDLRVGAKLPSLRGAARSWGVNLHTIRRAYAHLEERGIVRTLPRVGTRVLAADRIDADGRGGARCPEEFAAGVAREARERWGLAPGELIGLLRDATRSEPRPEPRVHVVECSESQARDLAAQVEARWRVRASPWSLERDGEPDGDAVVATYFHYNDVRCRWPHRFTDVHFAATHPDPGLRERVASLVGARGEQPARVALCEREPAMARNIAADLTRILPPSDFAVRATLAAPADALRDAAGPVLFAPRVWGEMDAELRRHPAAVEVRYVFADGALEAVAAGLSWTPRA